MTSERPLTCPNGHLIEWLVSSEYGSGGVCICALWLWSSPNLGLMKGWGGLNDTYTNAVVRLKQECDAARAVAEASVKYYQVGSIAPATYEQMMQAYDTWEKAVEGYIEISDTPAEEVQKEQSDG